MSLWITAERVSTASLRPETVLGGAAMASGHPVGGRRITNFRDEKSGKRFKVAGVIKTDEYEAS